MMQHDLYIISGEGGDGHNFLASCIVYALRDDSKDMVFINGHSHSYYENYLTTDTNYRELTIEERESPQFYNLVNSKVNMPLVLLAPDSLDFDDLKQKNINFVHIAIQVSAMDRLYCESNHFFKVDIHNPNSIVMQMYKKGAFAHLDIKKDAETLVDFSPEEIHSILESKIALRSSSPVLVNPELTEIVDFNDIFFDKAKFLAKIEQLTGKPVSAHLDRNYDNFIEAQKDLVAQKMPWLAHKY